MKKVAIPVLTALVACPAMAGQQYQNESFWDSINPYMALRVGAGYTNHNYSYNDKKESLTDEELHGRVALGLSMWCNKARTEIEWSMFTKTKDDASFDTPTSIKVDTKLQTLLMNAYMDLGDYQMIRPFVGVGAGVAFADVSRTVPGERAYNRDRTRFSAMGTMGVTFDWRVFAVDMAFRYTYADVNSGLHNFGGDIGLRYMF
ncbi:MAG: outer membrane beta-barrel protein [Alphaproteobacteria bacterium]|nr:outer membrane beta-barrel protein [Alphaproteobacteria bacterium]